MICLSFREMEMRKWNENVVIYMQSTESNGGRQRFQRWSALFFFFRWLSGRLPQCLKKPDISQLWLPPHVCACKYAWVWWRKREKLDGKEQAAAVSLFDSHLANGDNSFALKQYLSLWGPPWPQWVHIFSPSLQLAEDHASYALWKLLSIHDSYGCYFGW